jgi:predicted nuclease of predicted toxin-antitoxin system
LRWLADENFNNDILRALRRRRPGIDMVRVQDAGLTGADDEAILAWAAEQDRVLLTHDVSTITAHAAPATTGESPIAKPGGEIPVAADAGILALRR